MKFEIITLFPDYFSLSLKQSLVGKAWDKKLFDIEVINLRDFAVDKHNTVDDTPYGGGGGMVLMVEPLDLCLQSLGYRHRTETSDADRSQRIVLTTAAGDAFSQKRAIRYSLCDRVTIICGHYLGVDERILELYDIEEVSIGDYVLSGGEPAAAVMVDAVGRLIPSVLGNFESALEDSFMNQKLGAPVYTRPVEYQALRVPEVMMSGNHAEIRKARLTEAVRRCYQRRPDLLADAELSEEELQIVRKLKNEIDISEENNK